MTPSPTPFCPFEPTWIGSRKTLSSGCMDLPEVPSPTTGAASSGSSILAFARLHRGQGAGPAPGTATAGLQPPTYATPPPFVPTSAPGYTPPDPSPPSATPSSPPATTTTTIAPAG